jgi:ribonuclease-3
MTQPGALELELGYRFRDPGLLERALTHKSRAYEQGSPEVLSDNEQLEFLGDSILGFLVSEWLVSRFPGDAEGRLSKLKAHLVSAAHLHISAQHIQLGKHLLLGRGEELSGGREKKTILANALEALIAAIYLDGGLDAVRSFVVEQVLPDSAAVLTEEEVVDFKGALKELATALHLPPPMYTVVEERGPEHAKTFVLEVRVGREWSARAGGFSKKSAGQEAARLVLDQLRTRGE